MEPRGSSKEWILNIAFNRWQYNRPRYVGKLSESIRECAPRTLEEWERYYFEKVRPTQKMLADTREEHLNEIGRRLYVKISEQLRAEIEAITEEDCIQYVYEVVIKRTFEGYLREKKTVYEQLETLLQVKMEPAPDEWDRKYNIDFYIKVGERYIGIQIKPVSYAQLPEAHKWHEWMAESHRRFEKQVGGRVFIVFSIKKDNTRQIANPEVVDAIREEIARLRREQGLSE
ncbi:MAG: MjaI family restriction endonuclease [Fimbriimonadales bacterium]|nr:MjaI family restriction endonuclease [Fimbriimonadales bacterium]